MHENYSANPQNISKHDLAVNLYRWQTGEKPQYWYIFSKVGWIKSYERELGE